ncbi:hypothetical protein Tco_1393693 [Tanacetum coccineum]
MVEYSQKWHNETSRGRSTKTSDGLAAIQAQLNNLGREIKKVNEKVYAAQEQRQSFIPRTRPIDERYPEALFMSESENDTKKNSNFGQKKSGASDRMLQLKSKWHRVKTLEIQTGQVSKVLQERGFGSLPSSIETNPRDQVKSISTTIEADSNSIRRIGSNQYAVSTGQNSTLLYKAR